MIMLRQDVAWVRGADDRLRPFDGGRLAASLQEIVSAAGLPDHILTDSIVATVHRYVCECCPNGTVTAPTIAFMVRELLTMLGLSDIARAYEHRNHWAEIRLDQMATAGDFELGFYQRLDARLRAVADVELELVQLRGLRACVMRLRGAQRWNSGCRALADEIIGYVRGRVERVRPTPAAALCVEVME